MGATKYLYTIDGLGRRIARSHQPAAGGTITVDEEYVYLDQTRVGAVLDGTGALLWRFVYATGRHTPDYAVDASGTLFRLVTDQLGSVRLVVNATSGAIVQRADYDAWGNATDVTLPAHPLALGFAGGWVDRSTKLVHFGAREYDPEVGAWTSKDPSGFRGGLNAHGYAESEPVNSVDPTGLAGLAIGVGGSAELGLAAGASADAGAGVVFDFGGTPLWAIGLGYLGANLTATVLGPAVPLAALAMCDRVGVYYGGGWGALAPGVSAPPGFGLGFGASAGPTVTLIGGDVDSNFNGRGSEFGIAGAPTGAATLLVNDSGSPYGGQYQPPTPLSLGDGGAHGTLTVTSVTWIGRLPSRTERVLPSCACSARCAR